MKASDFDFYQSLLTNFVLHRFSYEVLAQFILANNFEQVLFRKVKKKEEVEKFLKGGEKHFLEIPYHFNLSISRIPSVFGKKVSALRMHEFTKYVFPDAALLYDAGTTITIFYDLTFQPREAVIDFSNLVALGRLPVLVVGGDFWAANYPELMNNLFFIDKQLSDFVTRFKH